jgi:hypothetical protein
MGNGIQRIRSRLGQNRIRPVVPDLIKQICCEKLKEGFQFPEVLRNYGPRGHHNPSRYFRYTLATQPCEGGSLTRFGRIIQNTEKTRQNLIY